jgi:hypothetical protein
MYLLVKRYVDLVAEFHYHVLVASYQVSRLRIDHGTSSPSFSTRRRVTLTEKQEFKSWFLRQNY